MEVILINTTSNIVKSLSKVKNLVSYEFPSIGLAYIAAILKENKIRVRIIDQFIDKIADYEVLNIIKKDSPGVVGFSCLTHNMGTVRMIIKEIKKAGLSPVIVLGNIHASIFADILLKEGIADIVVHGEGEYAMLDILEAVMNMKSLHGIEGISFREGNEVCHNPLRAPIADLDKLPYPSWESLNVEKYPYSLLLNGIPFPLRTSRGCAYQCYFCVQDAGFKTPRLRKIKNVVDEIEYLINKFGVNKFVVLDSFFPFTKKYGYEFSYELINRGLGKKIQWGIETRVDSVDFSLLKTMKEAGLRLVLFGFEVGNQKMLNKIGKESTLDQAKIIVNATKELGIISQGLFILGLPGETKNTCEQTIKFAKELNCDLVKFNLAMPFPGSKFYEDYKDKIVDINQHPENFDSWSTWSSYAGSPVYVPEGMTGRELIGLQRKAMLQCYASPKWVVRQIIKRKIPPKYMFCGAYVLISDFFKNIVDELQDLFN